MLCKGYIVLFGVGLTQGSSGAVKLNDVFVFRLADFVPGYEFPLRDLDEFVGEAINVWDVRVTAQDGAVFYSQSAFLSVCFPLLALDLLPGGTVQTQTIRYLLQVPCSALVLREFMRFLYTDSLTPGLNTSILTGLLALACRYGLLTLKNKATRLLEAAMNLPSSIEILKFCKGLRLDDELKGKIARLGREHEDLAKKYSKVVQKLTVEGVVGKALGYLKGQWERLQQSGEAGRVPEDVAIAVNTRTDPSIPRTSPIFPQDPTPTRSEMMCSLYQSESTKDFTLLFPSSPPLRAHSAVLFAASLYFRSLITSGLRESQVMQVTLGSEHSREEVELIIRYMYEGPSVLTGFTLPQILSMVKVADYYRIVNNDAK